MKKLTLLVVVVMANVFLLANESRISFNRSNLSGDLFGTLTLENSPYYIVNNANVPEDSTLIIEPGVEINFTGLYILEVHGTLTAIGTSDNPITFIGDQQVEYGYDIFFDRNSDDSILQNCEFKDFNNKILSVYESDITIKNSNFHDNNGDSGHLEFILSKINFIYNTIQNNSSNDSGRIIYFLECEAIFTNNNFIDNTGCIVSWESQNTISNNVIKNNNYSMNSVYTSQGSDDFISNNLFANNRCEMDAGAIKMVESNSIVTSNIITNNYSWQVGGGLYLINFNGEFSNNLITNNTASSNGAGIYLSGSNGIFRNNTIAKNKTINHGSGIVFSDNSNPFFVNNIIYANRSIYQVQVSDSSPYIVNCDVEGGLELFTGTGLSENNYINNIDSNPLWLSPAMGVGYQINTENTDYHLENNSPCIDAGFLYSDEDGTISDLGAFTTDNYAGNGELPSDIIESSDIPEVIDSDMTIIGNINIQNNETLTINPGITVKFIGSELNIYGTLIAEGTEESPITFTNYEFANWQGIKFLPGSKNCIISHSIIKNSRNSGITCVESNPIISNNTICNNMAYSGGGINISFSKPEIKNNLIINNSAIAGGGITFYQSEPIFRNNTIAYNSALHEGGGLEISSTYLISRNNIIYGNHCIDSDNLKIYVMDPRVMFFINCDIEGGMASINGTEILPENYINNIDAYPMWVSPSEVVGNQENLENIDYRLKPESPCIDNGSIYYDEDGTVCDIGAFTAFGPTAENIPGVDICHGGILSGTIENDMVIDGNVMVPSNSSLTINPGVKLKFIGSILRVKGSLNAEGTEDNPIIFCGYNGAFWKGIDLEQSSFNNHISYSVIKNSVSSGIWTKGADFTLNNSIVCNNLGYKGGGLNLGNTDIILKNNLIINNTAIVDGGGIYSNDVTIPGESVFNLNNNTITRNYAEESGAGIFLGYSGNIKNTIVYDNVNPSTRGEQIFLKRPYPYIVNCDIQHGSFGISSPELPAGHFLNNINSNPLWVSPSEEVGYLANINDVDYHLQENSPCIDAGNFNYDENGSISDIGAYTVNGWAGTGSVINTPPQIIYILPGNTNLSIVDIHEIHFSVFAQDFESDVTYTWYLNSVNQNTDDNTFIYNFNQNGVYEIKCIVSDGENEVEQLWNITVNITGNSGDEAIPEITRLIGNYPNPFKSSGFGRNQGTTINFTVKKGDKAKIEIFNVKGQIVKTYPVFKTGHHKIIWEGKNNNGRRVASGIYFYRLKSKFASQIHKMLLLK